MKPLASRYAASLIALLLAAPARGGGQVANNPLASIRLPLAAFAPAAGHAATATALSPAPAFALAAPQAALPAAPAPAMPTAMPAAAPQADPPSAVAPLARLVQEEPGTAEAGDLFDGRAARSWKVERLLKKIDDPLAGPRLKESFVTVFERHLAGMKSEPGLTTGAIGKADDLLADLEWRKSASFAGRLIPGEDRHGSFSFPTYKLELNEAFKNSLLVLPVLVHELRHYIDMERGVLGWKHFLSGITLAYETRAFREEHAFIDAVLSAVPAAELAAYLKTAAGLAEPEARTLAAVLGHDQKLGIRDLLAPSKRRSVSKEDWSDLVDALRRTSAGQLTLELLLAKRLTGAAYTASHVAAGYLPRVLGGFVARAGALAGASALLARLF